MKNRIINTLCSFALFAAAPLFIACSNDYDGIDIETINSELVFSKLDAGTDISFSNWQEWVVRYMWYDHKGVVQVKYDEAKDAFYVEASDYETLGIEDTAPISYLHNFYDERYKYGNPTQLYIVGYIAQGFGYVVSDYFHWPVADNEYPRTKEEGRTAEGKWLDWTQFTNDEVAFFNGENFWAKYFNGIQEWNEVYKDLFQALFDVKYNAALDAFVASPAMIINGRCTLFILKNYYPTDMKEAGTFRIWAAGKMSPCNKRLHEDDGRLYKYYDVVDSFIWEYNENYHKPKGL